MSYSPWSGLTLEDALSPVSGVDQVDRQAPSSRGQRDGSASRGCYATVALLVVWLSLTSPAIRADDDLSVGFAHLDITPELRADVAVWLAGYYPGRAATGVHDPLFARCVVLKSGEQKIAWVSVDLIGLQFPAVQELRKRLTDFDYVLVASTHNHEGPDVIGVWGQSFLHRGVNDDYLALVVARMEQAVRRAEKHVRPARASFGTAADESLLRDNRLPIVKDGVLRLLRFADPQDASTVGLVVQWNCHPEALGADNSLITADFPAATIAALRAPLQLPGGVCHRGCRRTAGTADRSHPRRARRDAERGRLRVRAAVRRRGGGFGGARIWLPQSPWRSLRSASRPPASGSRRPTSCTAGLVCWGSYVVTRTPGTVRAQRWASRCARSRRTPSRRLKRKLPVCGWGIFTCWPFPARSIRNWCTAIWKIHRRRVSIFPRLRSSRRSPTSCPATSGCCLDWPMTRSVTSCRGGSGIGDHPTRTV